MEDKNASMTEEGRGSAESGDLGYVRPGNELQRGLKPRHLQMIAIGGVIGTGLFLGTANNLRDGGPGGLLLGYLIMASLLFSVMVALGEMISQFPVPGGQLTLAERFVSPELSFALGWVYWFFNIIVLPAEISAAVVLITFWTGDSCGASTSGICNNNMWVGLMLMVVYAFNFSPNKAYGEMEFWFASIKVITVTGLILLGIIISAGGGPNHEAIGFKYWNETGGFVQYLGIPGAKGRFLGFFSVLINAAFAFIGAEVTAIAAAETADPRRAVPKAIKSVWFRLILFYICSAFIVGLLVSPSDPSLNLGSTAAKSPFVIAIKEAGIPILPSIVNAALLSSAWSAACADLFISTRALHGLAIRGLAPKIFSRTTKKGLPYMAVSIGALFALLSFMAASQNSSAGTVFGYFANLTSICGIVSWTCILTVSVRWHYGLKAQGIDRKSSLPYRAPWQPYLSFYGLFVCFVVLVFGGFTAFLGTFDKKVFVSTYLPIPIFIILLVVYKLVKKTKVVKYEDMDFVTGSSVDIPLDPNRQTKWKRIVDSI
ncbi:unnamed protein product [Discula destructiva]